MADVAYIADLGGDIGTRSGGEPLAGWTPTAKEAQRTGRDVGLAAGDFLAGIVAGQVERSLPS